MATGGHDSGDASPLDEMCDDLSTLYERLFPACTKWHNIGLKLKVESDTLEAIASKHNNPDDCLREMLTKRLQAVGSLSWREVCNCLRSRIVDRKDVAEKIEEWRKDIVNTTSKIQVPPLLSLPVTGGLNDCLVKQTNQVTSAMTTVGEISLTEDNLREEKCCDLQEKIDCLESQFSYLTREAGERLKQEHVPIAEFYRKVSSMKLSLKIVVGKYFKETFESVSSFDVFWGHLNQFWDFFNCELFQHVVRVMFTEADDPLLSKLAEYESELKEFLFKTKLCDFVDHWPFSITKPPETVIRKLKGVLITVHKKWEDCTLYDIKKTRKKFSEEFMLPPEFMVLVGAGNGSVSILLYVPPSLASSIKEQVKQGKEDFLADNGFLSITIDGVQVYPLPSMEQASLHGETLKREIKIKEEPTSGQDYQAPLSPLKHIKQETKADPQTTDGETLKREIKIKEEPTYGLAVTGEDLERVYTASLYYLGSELHSREIHFVVNLDTEIHSMLVREKYSSKKAVLGVKQLVEFEEDSLTLDIPMAGAKVKGGWKITPMFYPTVIKKHVDQFKPGQRIPYCHLNAEMTNKRKKSTPKLFHQVKLVGAKVPYNFITINLDPQRTLPETTFGDLVKLKPTVSSQGIAVNEDDKGDTNQLGTNDLQDVFSQLVEATKDWFDMGLALGIKVDILEGIKSNENYDKARLREMLTHWLRSSPSRTWSDICNGLRSDTVQQGNLADKIEEKYKEDSSRPHPLTGEKREATEYTEQVPPKRARSEEQ